MNEQGSMDNFQVNRKKLFAEYASQKADFLVNSRPYKSTQQIALQVVDPLPTGGVAPALNHRVAYAKVLAGTRVEWFGYGVGEAITFARGTKVATEGDTNMSKGRRTNGIEDLCIEGISASLKGCRCDYAGAVPPFTTQDAYDGTDTTVINAHWGLAQLHDPAALIAPPQLNSPFNLESTLMTALAPNMAIEFEWDRQRVQKIGTLDEIPEGGAKSYLRSNGSPETRNRYRVPEGFLWRRAGKPDSEFVVRGTITDDIVVPLSLTTLSGQTANYVVPAYIYADIVIRLHGVAFSLPSRN